MIERDPPFFFDVTCDNCSSGEARIEAEHFSEVADEIKSRGWKIKRTSGDWEHWCPDCVSPASDFE